MVDRSPPSPARRLAQLDGVRCLAVAMVLAYHGGVAGLSVAGYYGVDVFFVLSGFLITSLLLVEGQSSGRIDIVAFWGRRARRLLPALLVVLAAVTLYVRLAAPTGRYPGFGWDALSVVAYVSNWHFIASSSNYFAASAAPSLLTHTWSLAIEEQFYLLWPLVLWVTVRAGRRRGGGANLAVLVVSVCGAVGSAVWMAVLYHSGAGSSRLYYGTDTHAQSILVGAALAAALDRWNIAPTRARTVAAGAALAGLGWAACSLGPSDPASYQGGFLLVAVLAAVLIAALATAPHSVPSRIFSSPPLAYLGRISYGMYLWYFPLFAVVDGASTGLAGAPLLAVRTVADIALASASFHLVETPLRRLPRRRIAPRRVAAVGRVTAVASLAVVAAVVMGAAPAVSSPGPTAAGRTPLSGSADSGASISRPGAGAAFGSTAAGTSSGRLRLLVTGDSTGLTLGLALSSPAVEARYGLTVDDAALIGCGVAISAQVDSHGRAAVPPPPCNPRTAPDRQWPALLQRQIAAFHPDVVLVAAGRWEVQSRRATPTSRWTNISQPAGRSYVESQLRLAASIAASDGARVALATAPCFSSGEQPNGTSWPEDQPSRLAAYNALIRTVASGMRPQAAVVDLDAMVCPAGKFVTTIDGTVVRAPDGVHYPFFSLSHPASPAPDTQSQTEAFGSWIAPRILGALGSPASVAAVAAPPAAQELTARR